MAEQTTQEAIAEIWQVLRETAASQQETAASQKENAAQIKEMTAGLDRLEGLFGDQWGKMLEALVQPSALRLFQARGIAVRRLHQRSKAQRNGDTMEVDLILENGADLVVVEVKSKDEKRNVGEILADVEPEDLIKYGLIPEFVGRLPVIATLEELDIDALVSILIDPKNALTKQYGKLFEMEGVEVDFREDGLRAIAERAMERRLR